MHGACGVWATSLCALSPVLVAALRPFLTITRLPAASVLALVMSSDAKSSHTWVVYRQNLLSCGNNLLLFGLEKCCKPNCGTTMSLLYVGAGFRKLDNSIFVLHVRRSQTCPNSASAITGMMPPNASFY